MSTWSSVAACRTSATGKERPCRNCDRCRRNRSCAASVYDAGWNDDALYSTVLVTALFNFYDRLADGVGLSLQEGYPAEAGKRLAAQGYDVFAQMAKTG
jgi:hypothetical protein